MCAHGQKWSLLVEGGGVTQCQRAKDGWLRMETHTKWPGQLQTDGWHSEYDNVSCTIAEMAIFHPPLSVNIGSVLVVLLGTSLAYAATFESCRDPKMGWSIQSWR